MGALYILAMLSSVSLYYCRTIILENSVPFDVDFSDDDGSLHEIGVTAGIPGTSSQSLTDTVIFQQAQSTSMWVTYIQL